MSNFVSVKYNRIHSSNRYNTNKNTQIDITGKKMRGIVMLVIFVLQSIVVTISASPISENTATANNATTNNVSGKRTSVYKGRITDEQGQGLGYVTIYPKDDPISGTASNEQGEFRLESNLADTCQVIISFIGYEKKTVPLKYFKQEEPSASKAGNNINQTGSADNNTASGAGIATVVLKEQPIALQETIKTAKKSKQRNKKKQTAQLLHQVYVQMDKDFSDEPVKSRIVSDVSMDSEGERWGMEQMIATVVDLPGQKSNGKDSVQFKGEYCKRFFQPAIRANADSILAQDFLKKDMRQAATAIDSGVVVHKALWGISNAKDDFEETVNDIKHWSVSNESEDETVVTYTKKRNILGIFVFRIEQHYIVNSMTLSLRRTSQELQVKINIPFGIKLDANQLQLLNLLNMGEKQIEKFRLRKANARVRLNTIYERQNGHLYIEEKNLNANATITGAKKMEIPIAVQATQQVTQRETDGVKPMKKKEMTNRVKREIVEIY